MDLFWVDTTNADSEDFDSYQSAVTFANERADELEADGWKTDRSWASSSNMYAVRCTKRGFQPINIQINKDQTIGTDLVFHT